MAYCCDMFRYRTHLLVVDQRSTIALHLVFSVPSSGPAFTRNHKHDMIRECQAIQHNRLSCWWVIFLATSVGIWQSDYRRPGGWTFHVGLYFSQVMFNSLAILTAIYVSRGPKHIGPITCHQTETVMLQWFIVLKLWSRHSTTNSASFSIFSWPGSEFWPSLDFQPSVAIKPSLNFQPSSITPSFNIGRSVALDLLTVGRQSRSNRRSSGSNQSAADSLNRSSASGSLLRSRSCSRSRSLVRDLLTVILRLQQTLLMCDSASDDQINLRW
jgi:hypothetical protein